jgi:hypothetical protein
MIGTATMMSSPTALARADRIDPKLGLIRLGDLDHDWHVGAPLPTADTEQALDDAIDVSVGIPESTTRTIKDFDVAPSTDCRALRALRSLARQSIASPQFTIDGVHRHRQLATLGFRNWVLAYSSASDARRVIRVLQAASTTRCVKAFWLDLFRDQVRSKMTRIEDTDFASEALRHTHFKVIRATKTGSKTIGYFGSFTIDFPTPSNFAGTAVRLDAVAVERFVIVYLVSNARASTTGDGDPGISREEVARLDKQMDRAGDMSANRLRTATT